MQKYKVTATKGQKKYSLIMSAESQKEAQEKIHNEGYSILKIEEYDAQNSKKRNNVKRFVFRGEKGGEIKTGIIMGDDIFKLYVKLRDELDYKVTALYPEDDPTYDNEVEVKRIIENLSTGYELQKKSQSQQKTKKIEQTKEQSMTSTGVSGDFYLKKQLEATYKLVDAVIGKFHVLFQNRESFNIDDETFKKLQEVYTKIITIKSSTNLPKLKEIGELALIKIAEVELKGLQVEKTQKAQEYLKETNRLLKKIGSKEQFKDPDTDMVLYLKNTIIELINKLKLSSIKEALKKDEKKVVDTETYEYLKLLLQLEKYEKKLKDINGIIIKSFLTYLNPFNTSEEKVKVLLKKKVIEQNIAILKAKKAGRLSSYTSIKKGFQKTLDSIADFLKFIEGMSISFVVIFSYLFLLSIIFSSFIDINTGALPYFLLFFLLVILTEIRRHIFILFFYIVFFLFSFIFIQVNF
ncbi:hypothetical protein LAT59_02060 [Candidatus Gracilibacteria bacterium]|nr:hypothetical protein [Candidatus Gracilibacteria bacterium]